MKLLVLAITAFALASCGKPTAEKAKDPTAATPGGTGSFHGFASRCVADVQETNTYLEYRVKCSPIFTGQTKEAVDTSVNKWTIDNCPVTLQIRNAKKYLGCDVLSNRPPILSSVNKQILQTRMLEPGECQPDGGRAYGTPRCR